MKIETVEVKAHPMLYVHRKCDMEPAKIAEAMGSAFQILGTFIDENGIVPTGAPYSVYRTWGDVEVSFDVGFPVDGEALIKAAGEVQAGETPSGRALKAVHVGPYDKLAETYATFESDLAAAGMTHPSLTWEIYLSDPDSVPQEELVTEIYMALAE